MEELKKKMADEQLSSALRKSRGGRLGGKILSLLGVVIAVAGMILGGNYVVVIAGGVILALGQDGARQIQGQCEPAGLQCHRAGYCGRRP